MNKYIKNRGQVAVEYVLLLIIVIALASVFKEVIDLGTSNNPDQGSAFVKYWRALIRAIGEDVPHP